MNSCKLSPSNPSLILQSIQRILRSKSVGYKRTNSKSRGMALKNVIETEKSDGEIQYKDAMESLLINLFATVSTIKAAYLLLQIAESGPYDADTIRLADQIIISCFRNISLLKFSYLKKCILPPTDSQLLSEIQDQHSLVTAYKILTKNLELELQFKHSECIRLREELQKSERYNNYLESILRENEYRLRSDFQKSDLNPKKNFITVLDQTINSIQIFVDLLIRKMVSARWDLSEAATAAAAAPNVHQWEPRSRFLAFESYVCQNMFTDFENPNFSESRKSQFLQTPKFCDEITKLKTMRVMDYVLEDPKSEFSRFCRMKYLSLVHPKMEISFFGNLDQRNLINSGNFPQTGFFKGFMEMAKKVWLLHHLSFSLNPPARIFHVTKGSKHSEECMETVFAVDHEGLSTKSPEKKRWKVEFMVEPGFVVGNMVVRCKVFISDEKQQ